MSIRRLGAFSVVWLAVAAAGSAGGCGTSSSNAGGTGGEQCVPIDAGSCMGEPVTFCSTQPAGASACTSAHYQVGSHTFPCQSCSAADIEACGEQATMACLGDAGGTGGDAPAD